MYIKNNLYNYNKNTLIKMLMYLVPGPVHGVETEQWGSSAILLSWQPPEQPNGILTGYEISYESMTQEGVGEKTQRPTITNPNQTIAKLASLKPATNYRIYIKATTKAGVGEPYVFYIYLKKYVSILSILHFFSLIGSL